MSDLAALKARLIARAKTRKAYACHGIGAYNMPTTGWNRASEDGSRWVESLSGSGLRFVGYSDKIVPSIRHRGWYSDPEDQGDVFRGVVLALPARDGKPQYLAAYADPWNAGSFRVDLAAGNRGAFLGERNNYDIGIENDIDARDAARAADSFAERCAEKERDYQSAWQAGRDFADLGEEAAQHRRDALALIREIKQAGTFTPAICAALREHVSSHIADIRKAREQREELQSNVWSGLRDAFNDGAGIA